MAQTDTLISDAVTELNDTGTFVTVRLSNEVVRLLSDQLYQSPLKAIEELVVNSYDANATECRVFLPTLNQPNEDIVAVYDNGVGMTTEGLTDLWHIGRSNKRLQEIELRSKRKLIGKFGIGKLATYSIANRITHISKSADSILAVTVDFNSFSEDPTGAGSGVSVPLKVVSDVQAFADSELFQRICSGVGVDPEDLIREDHPSWTLAILEDLKDKVNKVKMGKLRWVLQTAMPMSVDFNLFLNHEPISSSKESYEVIVKFEVADLSTKRLESLLESTGEKWTVENHRLVSPSFPSGVAGDVIVTKRSLMAGKSSDIGRSHGFFVKVRGRLVNEDDDWFGISPKDYGLFYRLRADINADDLDSDLTASREGLEANVMRERFKALLGELFGEARSRFEAEEAKKNKQNKERKEDDRNFVTPQLVEYPIADVLATQGADEGGAEADESWFYLDMRGADQLDEIIQSLYSEDLSSKALRKKYQYVYSHFGRTRRMVKFDPRTRTFSLNEDHELVQAHAESGGKVLLEDMVTAEALLEVYLRGSQVPPHIVGEVLERRDALLRSLAIDHPYSSHFVSERLRDAKADKHDLEIALVIAARTLGFVATHISGAHEPDGLARITSYPEGEKKIILEAKSSQDVPSLGHIDFAGLREHMEAYDADGCLLVAPDYPGGSRDDYAAAANRARQQHISCWTIDLLAKFVETAEARHLAANDVLQIVLRAFTPNEVKQAVSAILEEPSWDKKQLYLAIVHALRQLDGKMENKARSFDMISAILALNPDFSTITSGDIEQGIRELASASQGGLTIRNKQVLIRASFDEIERRISGITRQVGQPRKNSSFRTKD